MWNFNNTDGSAGASRIDIHVHVTVEGGLDQINCGNVVICIQVKVIKVSF